MKIELLGLLTKIEEFVKHFPNANETFIPLLASKEETIELLNLMISLDCKEQLLLALAAKTNQSVLQMLWRFMSDETSNYLSGFGQGSPEWKAHELMLMSGYDDKVIRRYEQHYREMEDLIGNSRL